MSSLFPLPERKILDFFSQFVYLLRKRFSCRKIYCFELKESREINMPTSRIVLIGGGSFQWTPKIVADILTLPGLEGSAIVLEDINPENLSLTSAVVERMIRESGKDFRLETADNLQEALAGADFVIITISTGGLDAMEHDLEIPKKYGIFQSVGDTVGPGGWARALRNIPVFQEFADAIQSICPDAWVINYTNPMTVLTRTLTKSGLKNVVGLCHEFLGVSDWLRRHFQRETFDGMDFVMTGINHFNWIVKFTLDGQDAFPALHEYAREFLAQKNRTDLNADPFADNRLLKFSLFEDFGYLPAAGDRHLAEFLPNVLTRENGYGGKYWIGLTSIQRRRKDLAHDRQRMEEMRDGKREVLSQKSSEKVADMMDALYNGKTGVFITNLPNTGQVANLPEDAVVEGLAEIKNGKMVPLPVGDVPQGILPLIAPHIWRQEMIVEASFTGDWGLAVEALTSDPMIQDLKTVRKMANELRAAHEAFLPQFE